MSQWINLSKGRRRISEDQMYPRTKCLRAQNIYNLITYSFFFFFFLSSERPGTQFKLPCQKPGCSAFHKIALNCPENHSLSDIKCSWSYRKMRLNLCIQAVFSLSELQGAATGCNMPSDAHGNQFGIDFSVTSHCNMENMLLNWHVINKVYRSTSS